MNVVLIYAPMDDDYYTDGVNDCLPLGLLALYNYAIKVCKLDVNIDIIDGEYYSLEQILNLLPQYNMVCVQSMMASYKNTLKILNEAKKYNITTVLGGHHATQLCQSIMKNRHSVLDCIMTSDGEQTFVDLILNKPWKDINNLAYMDYENGKVIINKNEKFPINDNLILEIDNKLFEQYKRIPVRDSKLERLEVLTSFRSYSHKGCSNRENSQYCFFCGRADAGVRFKTPENYIKELEYLVTIPTIKYIFEIGDDFLQNEDWLREVAVLYQRKLKDSKVLLKIFARANRVNENVVKYLKMLNITEVAIGFESGSDKILSNINKNATTADNINAAKILYQNNIDTIASYVIGLPGEDIESLDMTYEQAKYIRELAIKHIGRPPQEIIANIIEVNPGAPAFQLLKKAMPGKYENQDLLGIKETQNDYFKVVFNLADDDKVADFRKLLINYGHKINSLGNYSYRAGWTMEDIMNE